MKEKIRVRFAPSPTGPLHMGGVRTALYNYLFARQHAGSMILRIEDTDQSRFVAGAEDYIKKSLKWCGIEIDEGPDIGGAFGPYRQSERKSIYKAFVDKLIETGYAYYAFDSREELQALRQKYESEKKTFVYNAEVRNKLNNSLSHGPSVSKQKIDSGMPYVIRFRMEAGRSIHMHDLVRGQIEVATHTLDDKILFKSDGMPTYHLANVVDDHLMEISHVIRGEEWLPSLPLHILLYEAFGWKPPAFAHLSLLLKPDGKGKLSKRDGDQLGFPVFPLEWQNPQSNERFPGYMESGYLPEAFVNMLALMGWNPGTEQELFSMDELIKAFRISQVVKSGARFSPDKARWLNHQYIQSYSVNKLAALFMQLPEAQHIKKDLSFISRVIELVRERAELIPDLWEQSAYFFEAPQSYDEKMVRKRWNEKSSDFMTLLSAKLEKLETWKTNSIENEIKAVIEAHDWSMGLIMSNLRLLLVGAGKGPHLPDIMELLGKKECLERIKRGIQILK